MVDDDDFMTVPEQLVIRSLNGVFGRAKHSRVHPRSILIRHMELPVLARSDSLLLAEGTDEILGIVIT